MRDWRDLWRGLFPRRMIEPDIRDELSFHIEERVRELVRSGLDEEAARDRVLERFGDVDGVEEACREYDAQRVDGQTWRMTMDGWRRDARWALRGMRRNPGFAATVILTLALGIGATTAVFSVVESFLLRELPFPDADRLVMIWENDRATGTLRESASPLDYYDFVDRARGFEGMGLYSGNSAVMTRADGDPVRLNTSQVSSNLAGVLGVSMQLGRGISADEDRPGAPPTVVISDDLWHSAFDRDPAILDRVLNLDGIPTPIVGVLPAGLDYPTVDTDAWVPIQLDRAVATRPNHWVNVIARMQSPTTVAGAQAEMSRIMTELEAEYPAENVNRGAFVERLSEVGRGDLRATLWVLFGAVLFVLAIACVNVANLMLARGATRTRELAVHTALGAGRGALHRRFLVEGLLFASLASLGGLVLARVGVDVLASLAPDRLLRLGVPEVNGAVLGFTLTIGVLVGLVFALLPVLQVRRSDIQAELKDGRSSSTTPRLTARRALVAAQLALAAVLLVGATLLMSTLRNLQSVDPGFEVANLLRMDYTLPATRYPRDFANWPNWVEVHGFNRTLIDEVEAIPGVGSAAVVTNHPLDPGFTNSFSIEGRDYDPEQGEITTRLVSAGYFETVGLRLVEGRLPSRADRADDPHVLVVNQKAAERYFPDVDPIGQRIGVWGDYREIVGIVENERMHGLTDEVPPAMYINILQSPPVATQITVMARTDTPPLQLADAMRQAIWSLDRELAVFNVSTMEATFADAAARERFASTVLIVFAAVAVLLAVLGVHGVLAYLVAQQSHEVGVRMALGATRSDVVRGVVRQGAAMAVLGIALGLFAAIAVSRALQGLLYEVSPTAPWAYVGVAAGLALAAVAATSLPAWKAASTDPVSSLRGE